jgi:glyoxylase-like metal-dependent hydrolase (beta-lactamase superfamily II)
VLIDSVKNKKMDFRRLRIFLIYFTIAFLSITECEAQEFYGFNATKVEDGIYLLQSYVLNGIWVSGNVIVIINKDDVFVIDSGMLPSVGELAVHEIKKVTSKPVRYLFVTHWHGDHWQGNAAFAKAYPGIQFITTEENRKNILNFGMLWAKKKYAENYSARIAIREKEISTGLFRNGDKIPDSLKKDFQSALPSNKRELEEINNMELIVPSISFNKQMTIRSGDRDIEMHYLGWGNTTGDGVVYLPKEKIIISGDLVVYPSPYESENFSAEWLATMEKLNTFQFDHLLPGHGPILNDHKYVDFLISFFKEIIKEVNAAVSMDKTLDETKLLVTNKTVSDELSAVHPEFATFISQLDHSFVTAAVLRAYPKAHEAKLN